MFLLTLKTNPTTNHRIQTSIIMPDTKPSTKIVFAVLFGIIDVNLEVFGHYALVTPGINKAKSSLQVNSKQPSMRAHFHDQLKETFNPTFKNLTENFSKVRIGSVDNLPIVIIIPITIQQKSSPASLWPLWSPKNWTMGKTKAWTIFWTLWTLTLGHCTRCHSSTSHPLSLAKWGQLFVTVSALEFSNDARHWGPGQHLINITWNHSIISILPLSG